MKKALFAILIVALCLTAVGGAIVLGSFIYARSNGVTLQRSARDMAMGGVQVDDGGVRVGFGPFGVDVDDEQDSVHVWFGPFGVDVDGGAVRITGSGENRSWGRGNSAQPDYYESPLERTLSFDSLSGVSISLVARELEITQGEVDGSVTLYERYPGEFKSFQEKNGRLEISVADRLPASFWSTSNRLEGEQAKVRLVIPANSRPDIQVDTVSGCVRIDGISAPEVTIETVNGELELRECSFSRTELNSVSGRVTAEEGSLGRVKTAGVSGDIQILGVEFDSLDAESVSARIELELPGPREAYSFSFESVSGRMEVDADSYRGGVKIGSGAIQVDAETVSSGVYISTGK